MKELNYFYSGSNDQNNEIPGSYKGNRAELSQSLPESEPIAAISRSGYVSQGLPLNAM